MKGLNEQIGSKLFHKKKERKPWYFGFGGTFDLLELKINVDYEKKTFFPHKKKKKIVVERTV